MGFEIPNDGTPVKRDTHERLPLTPLSSRKISQPSHTEHSSQGNDDSHIEMREVRRKLQETERALKRSTIENEKLKDQVRDRIRQRQEDATEKKRLRDESQITERRHSHETLTQLREEKTKNEALSMELQKMDSEKTFLKKRVDQFTQDHEAILRSNSVLEKKLQSALQQQKLYSETNEGQEIRNLELENSLSRQSEEIRLANCRIEELEKKLLERNSYAQRSDAVQKSLVDELTEARMDHAKVNDLTSRLQKCTQLLNERTSENNELRDRSDQLISETLEQKKLLNSLRGRLNEKDAQFDELTSEKKAIEKKLETEKGELSSLHEDIAQMLHDGAAKDEKLSQHAKSLEQLNEEKDIYEAENAMLRAQMKTSNVEVVRAKKAANDAEKRLDTLLIELQHSKSSMGTNEQQIAELKEETATYKSTISSLEDSIRDSRNEVALLSTRLDERETTIEQQKAALDEVQKELAENRSRQSVALKNMQEQTQEKREIEVRLQELEDQLNKKNETVEKGEERIRFLEEQMLKEKKTITEQEALVLDLTNRTELSSIEVNEKEMQMNELKKQLKDSHEELAATRTQVLALENERLEQRTKNEESAHKFESLHSQLQDTEKTRDEFWKDLSKSQQKLGELNQAYMEAQIARQSAENQLGKLQAVHEEEISTLKRTLTESQSACDLYKQQSIVLQRENEKLLQDSTRNENRASILENEVKSLEHMSEDLESAKEKHLGEISSMQLTIEQLESRQNDSARQLHRLMKDVRDSTAETMDVIRWRDEERAAHDELKKDFTALQMSSSEEILKLKHEVSEVRVTAENATQQLQSCMRENAALEKRVGLREEEIREQQVSLSTCHQELTYEKNEHNLQKESFQRASAEIGEMKQLVYLTRSEVSSLKENNHELSEKLRKADEAAFNAQNRCDKLQSTISGLKQDMDDVAFGKDSIKKDYDTLRAKYNALKEHDRKVRERLENAETTVDRLNAALHTEKASTEHQKAHYEQLVHGLEHTQSDEKKENARLSEFVAELKAMQNEDRRKMADLGKVVKQQEVEKAEQIAKAQEERDLFIKKYHAACYRNVEVERECHTARQNYLNEYESFEQLKMNQETVLNKVRERIIDREAKFRSVIDQEKKRASTAESKLNETNK